MPKLLALERLNRDHSSFWNKAVHAESDMHTWEVEVGTPTSALTANYWANVQNGGLCKTKQSTAKGGNIRMRAATQFPLPPANAPPDITIQSLYSADVWKITPEHTQTCRPHFLSAHKPIYLPRYCHNAHKRKPPAHQENLLRIWKYLLWTQLTP